MLQLIFFSSFLLFQSNIVFSANPSVIIVGAGPAGIAAATKLLENSITNITVVEAENRIGGRIHSVQFGNGYVDLGAEYCHGEKGNIVYELVKDFDIFEHSNYFNPDTIKIFNSHGNTVPADLAKDFINTISTYDENITITGNASLGSAFLKKYNSTILKKYSEDNKKLKLAADGVKMLHDIIVMHEGAFSWQNPAAGRHYNACPGDQTMTWKTRGYQIILDVLMKSYPNPNEKLPIDDKIILNKKVVKIFWKNKQVEVDLSDGSSLKADYLIFTPSIGVLRQYKDILFEPQLPVQKLNALQAFACDGIMKVILHFPERWWKNETMFFFLWDKQNLLHVSDEFSDGPNKDGISWVTYIPALVRVASDPNVLIAWVAGELLSEIEKTSDEIILKGCNYVIRKFFGNDYNITDANKLLKSQWITNPNFLGTYSFEKTGYFKEDVSYQTQLAEPLINEEGNSVVFFAGKATHPTLYSTVHGAISSGIREAERIINLQK